ncbi:hypothetical protein [Noviherbaspirillum malthae]|uniref:hypothetical protein n=1 Tax=Noviherbaspirillum malthae TaxID=1260987 RepID=UPI00188F572B|nr:hypothetical protein [Noviherbaspirillum malthae]
MSIIAEAPFREVSNQKQVDLSHLSQEQMTTLRILVAEIRTAQDRIGRELYLLTERLQLVYEMLGDCFAAFVESELGISRRAGRRYLQVHSVLKAHFTDANGRNDWSETRHITQGALLLLANEPADEVIAEIRAIAQNGQEVNEATVKRLIESREAELEARVAAAEAEVELAVRTAQKAGERAELELARVKGQVENSQELCRRLTEQRDSLEEEVNRLQKQETQVVERTVEVEVLPKGYSTVTEAIQSAEQALQAKTGELERVDADLKESQRKMAEMRANLTAAQAGSEDFLQMKKEVEALMLKFPLAMLKSMSDSDKNIKSSINALGDAMVAMGNLLKGA